MSDTRDPISVRSPALVVLHGPAASGKLTVARELTERTALPAFHNHLVVDLLTEIFPFGSAPFARLREEIWLQVMAEAVRDGVSLVFTFMPEATVRGGFIERLRATIAEAGGQVHFVRLQVSADEQARRLGDPARREFGKITDLAVLREVEANAAGVEEPPVDLDIDTDALDPASAAEQIIEHFGLQRSAGR